ncbi:MAG: hypothetical protein M3O66_07175, partial [Verrucomicrobiota bacterium]|nr:hypothetical protein [Verrucomicrobiota bacterium]
MKVRLSVLTALAEEAAKAQPTTIMGRMIFRTEAPFIHSIGHPRKRFFAKKSNQPIPLPKAESAPPSHPHQS